MLPAAERDQMKRQGKNLALDFAEIRVEDGSVGTPGGRVHIDWERGEAMVLVIPLVGNRPTVYPEKLDAVRAGEGGVIGYLLTGMSRWETFHSPSDSERARWVSLKEYEDPVAVPAGMIRYRNERAARTYEDMHPEYPGVIPTVHRGGTGARKVLILNFSHTQV